MEADEISVSTDDKTEDFGDNPTRDSLAEGLMNLFKPTVDSLHNSIKNTKQSQLELRNQIESLTAELAVIAENQQCPIDLDVYVKKLLDARRRITIINSILTNAQDRLNRIHQSTAREIARHQAELSHSGINGGQN